MDSQAIVRQARALNARVPVVARPVSADQVAWLRAAGVASVVQPEFEAGLEITRQALLHLGVPPAEIDAYREGARRAAYGAVEPSAPGGPTPT